MAPNPIAFSIGPIQIRWYGLLIGLGLVIGVLLAIKECERQKLNPDLLLDTVLWSVPMGIIGARLYYVAFEWQYFSQHPNEIYQTWLGGLAIHGGLLFGVGTGLFYLWRHKAPILRYLDAAAPSIVLAQAIGRWGNFFNQEAYGRPTLLPWGMLIAGEYRHPTFLYESLWDLGVFAYLVTARRRENWTPGEVALRYIVGYSLGRIWVEGLRTDSLMLGPIRVAQLVSLAGIVLGVAGIVFLRKRAKQAPAAADGVTAAGEIMTDVSQAADAPVIDDGSLVEGEDQQQAADEPKADDSNASGNDARPQGE